MAIETAAKAAKAAGENFTMVEPVGFHLAGQWLTGLVVQCPSMESILELVGPHPRTSYLHASPASYLHASPSLHLL